jgi:PAS domain S-box-containing protein
VGRDISDRRIAEAALRAERDLLNAILATSVQGITVLSPEGQIIFANERAETVLGLKRADLTARSYDAPEWQATALDGGPWPDDAQPFQRVLTTGEPVFDVQHAIVNNSGQRRLLSINGAPIKDGAGRITSLVFSVADITQQKQAEADLRTSEERLRALVHDIGVGVSLHAATGEILMANPAACAILGYADEADLIHDHNQRTDWAPIDEDGQLIPPEQRPVRRARLTGLPVHNQVLGIQLRRTGGERIWLLMNASPQFAPNGELRSIVCSFSDITGQRQLEERLRQAQKLEAVGRLAGGVAHDFNNLLTVISGACDLVLLDETLSTEARTDVEQILQSSRRAADLTRQLLAFSRRQVLQPHDLNLNDALLAAERLLRRLIGEDVRIVICPAADLWPVRADPTQMEQVVLNLALNARDAMPEGGTLTITTANVLVPPDGPLAERVQAPGAYVQLTVRDTGTGISPELQAYVFEPFFTTKESGRGTGLGLATVHGIVTQSGGTIWFTSATGEGTCFEIYLPRVQAAAVVVPELPALPLAPTAGRETVLVVEDEHPVRLLVERVLRRQGYRVLSAADGPAAQQLLAEYRGPIHLLLTDMVMPGGISGDQLALEVRTRYPHVRVLMMSGYAYTLTGAGKSVAPPDAFLQKPFETEILARKVRDLLDRSEPHHAPGRCAG